MAARVDTSGLERFGLRVHKAASGQLQKDLVQMLHEAGPKIETDIKRAAHTKMQRVAASTVDSHNTGDGISLGSSGGGLGGTLFPGAEFGGRKRPKRAVVRGRPVWGRPGTVVRRTTMQFLPHLGHEGYFLWPTVRDWMPKIEKATGEAVEQTLGSR